MEFNLAITLEHDFVREPIRTSVVLNDAVLYKGKLTEKVLEFTCEAKNENSLKIFLHNKLPNDTVVDKQNNIIKDTFIKVKAIQIDKRSLKFAINDLGHIKYDTGEITKNITYLSKNGYYEIKFDLPIKNFLQRYYSKWDKYKVIDTEKEIRLIDKFLESIK